MGGTGDFGLSLASLLRSCAAFFSQSVRLSALRLGLALLLRSLCYFKYTHLITPV
jgi:hypothetical protein